MTEPNEFIRGPRWRTRTTPARRGAAAGTTFALIVAAGAAVMLGVMWLIDWLGAPTWVVMLPWIVPTVGALVWSATGPSPANATDDDDDSWSGYTLRAVLVGDTQRRPMPVRLVLALVFGAPIAWATMLSFLADLTGVL